MSRTVLVIKIGSAIITNSAGNIALNIIKKLAVEISNLHQQYDIVLVSSGAVSSGKKYLPNYKGTLAEKKAAAAVGNPILIELYRNAFQKHGLTVAQALCERGHFSNRKQFLQLKQTFATFWENNIIPVVNENDVVSDLELKFSDNDELATLLAIAFNAGSLIICTSVGGLLDHDKNIVPVVEKINEQVLQLVQKGKTDVGLGGMLSKLTVTKLANKLGIRVIMCGIDGENALAAGLEQKTGTSFLPQKSNLKSRQKWLAGGSLTLGSLFVDKGAAKALCNRKSLLTVGVVEVSGKFEAGEVVQIFDEENEIIGVAKTKLSAADIKKQLSNKNIMAAHTDDIVLL